MRTRPSRTPVSSRITVHNESIGSEITDAAISVTPMLAELGIQILNVQSDTEGWELQLQLPDNDALVEFRAYCREEGVSFRVGTLYVETDGGGQTNFGLTDRQHDALKMAYERGYFDDPRGATLQELAVNRRYLFDGPGTTVASRDETTRRETARRLKGSTHKTHAPS